MSENVEAVESEQVNESATAESDSAKESVDWESKFNDMKAHSREWEKRSKENKSALDAALSERDDLQKKLDKASSERDSFRVRAETFEVAKEFGVDAGVLRGNSVEELREHAESLQRLLRPKNEPVPNAGRSPGKSVDNPELQAVRQLFGSN